MTRILILSMFVASTVYLPTTVEAASKASKDFTYRYGAIWSTAIRLLRVDRKYKILEKDQENGFILFEYPGHGAGEKCQASMELFSIVKNDTKQIRVQLDIANQPSYIKVHLMDKLEQKLHDEQGRPPPAKPVEKKKKQEKKKAPPAKKPAH